MAVPTNVFENFFIAKKKEQNISAPLGSYIVPLI